jgi:ADP-ribose pyrophosphatase YjhB (NUDIX family)
MHPIQNRILEELIINNGQSFANLNREKISSDLFTFHIKQLLKAELLVRDNGKYFLTLKGKMWEPEMPGRVSVIMAAIREIKTGNEYLLQKRLKEPLKNCWGFMTAGVKFGERTEEVATREFRFRCGLRGEPKFLGAVHRFRGSDEKNIWLDNYFFVYLFVNPYGNLINTNEGENKWMQKVEFRKLKSFPGFRETVEIVDKYGISYQEEFYKVSEI